MPVACPSCGESDDLHLVQYLGGDARRLRCGACGHDWVRGEVPEPVVPGVSKDDRLRANFPGPDAVPADRLAKLDELASAFDAVVPTPVEEFRRRYRQAFDSDIGRLTLEDLTHFYRSVELADMGLARLTPDAMVKEGQGAGLLEGARDAIDHLLHGQGALERRFTELVAGDRPPAFRGVKEAFLTKVLAAARQDEVIPLLKYDSENGKRQIASGVLGLELPARDATDWTIGRLAIWSSNLFAGVTVRWFEDLWVGADFVWKIWDHVRHGEPFGDLTSQAIRG